MMLNIGCEFAKREGCINIDIRRDVSADVVCMAEPFRSDSVDGVYMHNFLEHVLDTLGIMEEIYRICKNDAFVNIIVPHFSSRSAWVSPDHVKAFSLNSFWNFMPGRTHRHYSPVFTVEERRLIYSKNSGIIDRLINWIARKIPDTFERRFVYLFGGCDEVHVKLRAVKTDK